MDELLKAHDVSLKSHNKYDKIDAKLKSVGQHSATFDVGGKADGVLEGETFIEAKNYLKTLEVGDSVRALVLDPETPDGTVLLSLRHAAADDFWKRMEQFHKDGKIIEVVGQSASNHGLMVSLEQETAFIPASQFGPDAPNNLEDLEEKRVKVKIIDLDKDKNRIVLSERAVSEAEDIARTKKALKAVKKGDEYEGEVTTIVSFGVFVEIEVKVGKEKLPIEGLVHISEMSWGKVDTPEELVEEGDTVKVTVIGSDKGKLALSMKDSKEDPWEKVAEKYKAETQVKGNIVKISDYGAFVEIEPGIEGLIHMTKIPPGTALKEGQEMSCYIEDVDTKNKKISLGIQVTTSKPVGYR